MRDVRPGGEELVAPERSSAEGLNMLKENPFLSNLRAGSAKTNALRLADVFMRGLLAILILCAASSTAQEKKPNTPASEPINSGAVDDSLRSIYPNLPPNQDPAAVARGKDLYGANCAFCHGKEANGGNTGPDLLRSVLVNHDEKGELIGPVIRQGRTTSISAIAMHASASPTKSPASRSVMPSLEKPISHCIVALAIRPTTTWRGSRQSIKAMNCSSDGLILTGNRLM
jgi:mono/diheme cytochrome c family protein